MEEKHKSMRDECQKSTKVAAELLDHLDKGEYKGDGSDLNCYPKCYFLKAGFMDDKGEINEEVMKEMVKDSPNKDKLDEIIDHCNESHAKGKDACEIAFNAYKCFADHRKEAKAK